MRERKEGSPGELSPFVDLYELTMAKAYRAENMRGTAVFELYCRELPPNRGYLVAAGQWDAVSFLRDFSFSGADLEYLRSLPGFDDEFVSWLGDLRFRGDVYAVPEGTVVFAGEPLLQVVAEVAEAQVFETLILNQIHFQTLVATKAARIVDAARGRSLVDFGARRAHGLDAAVKAARCAYAVGFDGTSNLAAGRRYGIPVFGTMAHSYIQAHERELEAYRKFAEIFPGATLLVDTYDAIEGVRKVVELAGAPNRSVAVRAIRLDSGDIAELAVKAREILDEAGLHDVKIFASSGLDEYKIAELIDSEAPIDGFGVGTKLVTSEDVPSLEMAYKLVEYDGKPAFKLSPDKAIIPMRKQVFRRQEEYFEGDTLALFEESLEGAPLLRPVMLAGEPLEAASEPLEETRARVEDQLARIPPAIRGMRPQGSYRVGLSGALADAARKLRPR